MQYHVCLDPGHGPGCANRSPDGSFEEQAFAMDMAQRIARLLRAQGVIVTLSRSASEYPSLQKRCQIANGIPKLSLFVSLHSNAAGGAGWNEAHGHMLFTSASGEKAERNRAAGAILAEWKKLGIPLRPNPLRHQGFAVLRDTIAPAVLLEHGFHTNREEVAMLKDSDFRAKLAEADARGILAYLGFSCALGQEADRARVALRFGLQEETLDYLEAYPFGKELLHKLAEGR